MSLLQGGWGQSMCCYVCVSVCNDEGENGERGEVSKRNRARERKQSQAVHQPLSHTWLETVTGNSLSQQLQGEMIKEWRNPNQKSKPLSFHTSSLSSFFFFFAPSLNTKEDQVLSSATGAVIPSEFRDIYQSPCKQDLIGIKSYVAKKSFSQQAKHGDGLDYLRYRGMLLS